MTLLAAVASELPRPCPVKGQGRISAVRGPVLFAKLPHTAIGDLCIVKRRDGSEIRSQVVSFSEEEVCLAPFDELEGVAPGAAVTSTGAPVMLQAGLGLVGKVVDCFGLPLGPAGDRSLGICHKLPLYASPSPALDRPLISEPLSTGVAAIDGLSTLGFGQRVGLFAGAGVGKSTVLGMISRNAAVDLSVIALVGERGREVREFLETGLGPTGMERAIAVVSTSDEPAIRRALAIETATAIAEFFAGRGMKVLLLVDSLTRAARAMREVGLAAGELPIRQGYTASVYARLPKILERAGPVSRGSITAVYTVLTNGDGESDPLGEEVRSLLDGHLVLDSKLSERGIRPAIDPTVSVSRLMGRLQPDTYQRSADTIRVILSRLKRDKDVLLFGGAPDRELAAALAVESELTEALCQRPHERRLRADVELRLTEIATRFRALSEQG